MLAHCHSNFYCTKMDKRMVNYLQHVQKTSNNDFDVQKIIICHQNYTHKWNLIASRLVGEDNTYSYKNTPMLGVRPQWHPRQNKWSRERPPLLNKEPCHWPWLHDSAKLPECSRHQLAVVVLWGCWDICGNYTKFNNPESS